MRIFYFVLLDPNSEPPPKWCKVCKVVRRLTTLHNRLTLREMYYKILKGTLPDRDTQTFYKDVLDWRWKDRVI